MNNITFEKLNYNELKEIVKGYCVSGLGKKLIEDLKPSSNINTVKKRLNETTEGRRLLDLSYYIPLDGIFNIIPLIDKVEKGLVLEPSDLIMLSDFLEDVEELKGL